MKSQIICPDLTQRPPRSRNVRLGGLVLLPRMLDKGRATLAGKNGKYQFNSPTDQLLVRFLRFDPAPMLKELAFGKNDTEMLDWVRSHSKTPRAPWEIEAWSAFIEKRRPGRDTEALALFADYLAQYAKTREDITTWFEIQRVRRAVTRSDLITEH